MEGRSDTGVKGFFADYDEDGHKLPGAPVVIQQPEPTPAPSPPASTKPKETKKKPPAKTKARIGRPPGITNGSRAEKEKATMSINRSLLDFYRDWSWEARCNVGELIERAMVEYKDKRSTGRATKSAPS